MTATAYTPGSARVSILERLVPSLGLIVTAISGAIGALMIFRFFNLLRSAEVAGRATFFAGTAEIEFVIGAVLVLAAIVTGIGILLSITRLFTTNTTSSPSGIFFLLLGPLSVAPPILIFYIVGFMKVVMAQPGSGGVSAVAQTIEIVSYIAIGAAFVMSLILLVFAFVPFSSSTGRKASTVICLVVVEIMIVGLAGSYFWQGRESLAERDRGRVEEYSQPVESPTMSPTPDDDDNESDFVRRPDAGVDPGIIASNTNSKTISGGVLNAKAVTLPQPPYPPAARAVRAAGTVNIQVTVDENGNVVSADAVSGHPLLRAAAVQAARSAKFLPTKISGQPVKVTGVITYKFEP